MSSEFGEHQLAETHVDFTVVILNPIKCSSYEIVDIYHEVHLDVSL